MTAIKAKNTKLSRNGAEHPFASKDPKPTRARLVSLLDPLGRKRYGEIERYLATVSGASSGLYYYENEWGWAVRYMLGTKNALCTLHLLPNTFEATVALPDEFDIRTHSRELSSEIKRRIGRTSAKAGTRWVRMPIRSDSDYANFKDIIRIKAETLRNEEIGKAKTTKSAKAKPAAEPSDNGDRELGSKRKAKVV